MKLPSSITLCEVGLRDGLQNETYILNTEQKLEMLLLYASEGCASDGEHRRSIQGHR